MPNLSSAARTFLAHARYGVRSSPLTSATSGHSAFAFVVLINFFNPALLAA